MKKCEDVEIKHSNDSKAFMEYSNFMDDTYDDINNSNPNRSCKILMVFDDMIADMNTNKKIQSIVKELIVRGRNLSMCFVFIRKSFFLAPNDVRLNSTLYLIMKIHNKRELQNVATNHSANIDYKDSMKIYRKYTSKSYSYLTINTILLSDHLLRFKKNLLDSL